MGRELDKEECAEPSVGDVVCLYGQRWKVVEVNPSEPRIGDVVLINEAQWEVVGVHSRYSRFDVGPTEAVIAFLLVGMVFVLAVLVNQFLKRL